VFIGSKHKIYIKEKQVAKGIKCPHCGGYMLGISEKNQPMGSWVVYECRKCDHTEKVFEDK